MGSRHLLMTCVCVLAWSGMAAAQTPAQQAALAKARQSYNAGLFDQAIASAEEARKAPALAPSAALVLGRAHLERFRATATAADLSAAHDALRRVDPSLLTARDQRDLTIGLGLTVFFEGRPGAASELLSAALAAPADGTEPGAREKLFDWWATAVDRAAQLSPEAGRVSDYQRMQLRCEAELARDPMSSVASYWLAAAARGAGDLDRAWDAAIAAWIRLRTPPPLGNVRDDRAQARLALDLLMTSAIIPERARSIDPRATQPLIAAMQAEWAEIKTRW